MSLEDVPHGLVTDGIAHVFESSNDAVVRPGAILLGESKHQSLQLRIGWGVPCP